MKLRHLSLACLLFGLAGTGASAAPAVIVNKGLSGESLGAANLKAVFLGKKTAWDSGGRVVLAYLKDGPVADAFLGKVTGLGAASFRSYWRRLVMTGGGLPPKGFDSEDELLHFVASTSGAVGFVDAAHADASVVTIGLP